LLQIEAQVPALLFPITTIVRRRRPALIIPPSESKYPMNKRQLIDEIRIYNPTAQPTFLSQFDEEALQQYCDHLKAAREKKLHISTWLRPQPKFRLVS
jgi:hypothetical protein